MILIHIVRLRGVRGIIQVKSTTETLAAIERRLLTADLVRVHAVESV